MNDILSSVGSSTKIRVAVVMAWYAPYRVPLLREVANSKDVDLTVIYCSPFEPGREWRFSGTLPFRSIFLEPTGIVRYSNRRNFNQLTPIDYPTGLTGALKKVNPQVVIAYEYHLECLISALFAAFSGCAYVTWSDVTALHDARMGRARKLMRRLLLGRSSALIGSSSDTLDHLCGDFGFPRSKAFLSILSSHLYDFMECARTMPDFRRNDNDCLRFLYVGRLIPCKGLDVLIRAFSSFSRSFERSRLTIVGNGPEKEDLVRLACDLGCDRIVEFIEHVPYESMAAEMARHDVFVLPSRLDVFGLVVAEAMACGLPVICSRNAGAANDLVRGNGIVVDADDPERLQAAFTRLAEDPELRSRMSLSACRVLKKHGLEAAVRGFMDAIDCAFHAKQPNRGNRKYDHDHANSTY